MKKVLSLFPAAIILLSAVLVLPAQLAMAYSNNDMIDDRVWDNVNSMTAAQIDALLNSYPNSCISSNNGFSASDPNGYTPDSNFIDGHYGYGSRVSAGTVIFDAAKAHSINPQVLVTKLENEENLVTGVNGCSTWRYASAVGYACPDNLTLHNYTYTSGADPYTDSSKLVTPLYYHNGSPINSITNTCVNKNVKAGFSEQVVHAAWLLSFSRHKSEGQTSWAAVSGSWNHCEDNDTCPAADNIPASWACYSGFMTQGNYKRCPTDSSTTFYDGYASIDGRSVHMDTGGTAALYVYTPHIQSFDSIFTPWFGNPTSNCESISNVSGADSGRRIVAHQYSRSGPTNLVFTRLNNTGSECAEFHAWALGFKSWAAHIATGMRATDPAGGMLLPGNVSGDNRDELIYMKYGNVQVHEFSDDLTRFLGIYDVPTDLTNVMPDSGTFVAGDFLGRGYDQLLYLRYQNAQGNLEVHMFSKDLRKARGTYDVINSLTGATKDSGVFVAGDFLGRGYDQLAYIKYSVGTKPVEVHVFSRDLRKVTGTYDVATGLSSSVTTGTFVAGNLMGTGKDTIEYVKYDDSAGYVEVHTFSSDLRKVRGVYDVMTNLSGFGLPF